ncbi:MAG: DUF1934 domain-containing protein [Erysipelotrichaceae bacterium]|nr:DUF1934 domain-containing protein [Erysipelotrichaceae bacterium]
MKVNVNFKKYKIENEKKELELFFNTNGIYQDRVLKFVDQEKVINLVTINLFEVVVQRSGEITSVMTFRNKQKTKFQMSASFGNLELDIYTSKLIIEKDSIYILYNVLEDINNYETYELHIEYGPLK